MDRGAHPKNQLDLFVLDASVAAEIADDLYQLGLGLIELGLSAFGVEKSLLETDRNAVEVFDLFDQFVGCPAQLAEAAFLGERAVTALPELAIRKILGPMHGVGNRFTTRLQSGYLYHYAFAMIVGIAAIVTWFVAGHPK